MNELDKLRQMLTDANIPFESRQEEQIARIANALWAREVYGEACKWQRNQVIYRCAEHVGGALLGKSITASPANLEDRLGEWCVEMKELKPSLDQITEWERATDDE